MRIPKFIKKANLLGFSIAFIASFLLSCNKNFPGKGRYTLQVETLNLNLFDVQITLTDDKGHSNVIKQDLSSTQPTEFSYDAIDVQKRILVRVQAWNKASNRVTSSAPRAPSTQQVDYKDIAPHTLKLFLLKDDKVVRSSEINGIPGQPVVIGSIGLPTDVPSVD